MAIRPSFEPSDSLSSGLVAVAILVLAMVCEILGLFLTRIHNFVSVRYRLYMAGKKIRIQIETLPAVGCKDHYTRKATERRNARGYGDTPRITARVIIFVGCHEKSIYSPNSINRLIKCRYAGDFFQREAVEFVG